MKWSGDGQAVLVAKSTPWHAEVYRVKVATGKRTLLEKMELSEKAGSSLNLKIYYSEQSKTYVYNDRGITQTSMWWTGSSKRRNQEPAPAGPGPLCNQPTVLGME